MPYLISLVLIIIGALGYHFIQQPNTNRLTQDTSIAMKEEEVTVSALEQKPTIIPAPTSSEPQSEPPQNVVPSTQSPTPPKETPPSIPTPPPGPSTAYKSGSYSSSVTYRVPSGRSYTMDVSLTVTGDTVTTSNVSFDIFGTNDGNTQNFVSEYRSHVIGQKLSQISLARVGGASITSRAFNQAIGAIKTKAS